MNTNSDFKITANLALLLVGEPKVGKTRLMASFPTPGIIDLDKNLGSAVRVMGNKKFFYDQIDKDKTGKVLLKGQRWTRLLEVVDEMIAHPEIETIELDGLGQLTAVVMDYIVAELKKMNVKLRTDTIDEQIRLADYQTYYTLILGLVAKLRASGKMVVWTSHQKVEKDEITQGMLYKLNMPGKLDNSLGGYFTDVWAMTATPQPGGKTKYAIRTKPTGYHVALGCSMPMEPEIDVTDKGPEEVAKLLLPKLMYVGPTTTTLAPQV